MSIQQNGFNPLITQRSTSSPNIDSGFAAGGVFDGRGSDFLSPKTILGNVDDFSQNISPVSSNNNFVLIGDPFRDNPQSPRILRGTTSSLNEILSPNFGANLFAPVQQAVPVTVNGGAVVTNTAVIGQLTQTPSPALIRDLSNFNPLIWENPNSANVLLGTMDAQNKIFGGNGLFTPNVFNQYPLYPFIAPPAAPYSGFAIPIPSQSGITTLQQAQNFPTVFLSNAPAFNTTFRPIATISTTQSIIPYQAQVALLALLQSRLDAMNTGTGGTIRQLNPANGVPPWLE